MEYRKQTSKGEKRRPANHERLLTIEKQLMDTSYQCGAGLGGELNK